MIEEMRNHSIDFLNGRINGDKYIVECRKLYNSIISDYTKSIMLDNIIIIPFVHEFAYCKYNDSELKSQVSYFLSILNEKENYCYSTFLKLLQPSNDKSDEIYLLNNFKEITINDLNTVFTHSIEMPLTIKDILNNIIFDILDKLNLEQIEESCFDYINCNENISFSQIKDKIMRLVSYYLGIDVLYIHINVNAKGRTFCVD